MDWSHDFIPAMQLEARFGDRVVPAFCERPKSIWAMVAAAAAENPDGEALVCGERRLTWREVAQRGSGRGCQSRPPKRQPRRPLSSATPTNFSLYICLPP